MNDKQTLLRKLPAIDRLLGDACLQELDGPLPHILVREAAQQTIEQLRQSILTTPAEAASHERLSGPGRSPVRRCARFSTPPAPCCTPISVGRP